MCVYVCVLVTEYGPLIVSDPLCVFATSEPYPSVNDNQQPSLYNPAGAQIAPKSLFACRLCAVALPFIPSPVTIRPPRPALNELRDEGGGEGRGVILGNSFCYVNYGRMQLEW